MDDQPKVRRTPIFRHKWTKMDPKCTKWIKVDQNGPKRAKYQRISTLQN